MIPHTHREIYETGDRFSVYFMGDVHAGNAFADEKQFARDCEEYAKNPFARFVLMGDLIDAIIFKDKRYRPAAHSGAGRDNIIDYEIDKFCDLAAPLQGRCIGALTGNHEDTITVRCGTNPSQRIADRLEAPFLGYSSLLKIAMSQHDGQRHSHTRSVMLHLHHGHGGGSRTAGGSITTLDRNRAHYEADVFAYGHVHKLKSNSEVVICHAGNKVMAKEQILLITGTYLRTLSETTTPTYSEKAGFPPTAIGCACVHLRPDVGSKSSLSKPGRGWVYMRAEV